MADIDPAIKNLSDSDVEYYSGISELGVLLTRTNKFIGKWASRGLVALGVVSGSVEFAEGKPTEAAVYIVGGLIGGVLLHKVEKISDNELMHHQHIADMMSSEIEDREELRGFSL